MTCKEKRYAARGSISNESIFKVLKKRENSLGFSLSACIRDVLGMKLKQQENPEHADFSGNRFSPIDSEESQRSQDRYYTFSSSR